VYIELLKIAKAFGEALMLNSREVLLMPPELTSVVLCSRIIVLPPVYQCELT
jgi:hypothetical protein